MKTRNQRIGAWGEQEAARFLIGKGYTIIEKNFRTRMGEIDIIAWHTKQHHGRTLCFIEVKTRGKRPSSGARATGRYEKMRAMQWAARAFCMRRGIDTETTPIQFEHIGMLYNRTAKRVQVHHVVVDI